MPLAGAVVCSIWLEKGSRMVFPLICCSPLFVVVSYGLETAQK